MTTTNIHDVAARVTEHFDSSISTMKLQKLCFFAQGWSLALLKSPLFDSQFQAWKNGPVSYDLFDHHRGQYQVSRWTPGDSSRLSAKQGIVVEAVLKNYGALSGLQLSDLTHKPGSPWSVTRARAGVAEGASSHVVIPVDTMAAFFKKSLLESR